MVELFREEYMADFLCGNAAQSPFTEVLTRENLPEMCDRQGQAA